MFGGINGLYKSRLFMFPKIIWSYRTIKIFDPSQQFKGGYEGFNS
jgi:hypothetical protein